jgi:CDP-paratose 2-epimerase
MSSDQPEVISMDNNISQTARPVLITGGAGFIGTNLAFRLCSLGQRVIIYDNLSRAGVEQNLQYLTRQFPDQVQVRLEDVRDKAALSNAVDLAGHVFHFAAQVAVTTSIETPMRDFEINAIGTMNLLEAIRTSRHRPSLLITSTNKVYGSMDSLLLRDCGQRYDPVDPDINQNGIDETWPLSFHSPYGFSKGTADQYVLDYSRTYGLKAVVFRMSCIYGPFQQGTEDQGWVAHFLIRAINEKSISIYGDGHQVRDILFIDDLVNAFLLAQIHMPRLSGQAFNIGGSSANTVSLLELIDIIGEICQKQPEIAFDQWRIGDQRYYVSNTARFHAATGWLPRVSVRQGVGMLYDLLSKKYRTSTVSKNVMSKVGVD